MTGVVGAFFPGDDGHRHSVVSSMLAVLAHRGPGGSSCEFFDTGFIGHLRHPAANAALFRSDDLIVAVDGRLDDEEEAGSPEKAFAKAYRKHGLHCVDHLSGDFSAVISDLASGRIVLYKDHMGTTPLYYGSGDGRVFFASEMKALLAADPSFGLQINEQALIDYVAGRSYQEAEATYYSAIRRLPPGHLAIIDSGAVEVRPYYRIAPCHKDPQALSYEGFREALRQAVAKRTATTAVPVVCQLSGGLDSSSLTVLTAAERRARGLVLPVTASIRFPYSGNDESPYIDAVRKKAELNSQIVVNGDEVAAWDSFNEILSEHDGPTFAPNVGISRQTGRATVRQLGYCLIVCGHGGDEIADNGSGYLRQLIRTQRWRELYYEMRREDWERARALMVAEAFLRSGPFGRVIRRLERGKRRTSASLDWRQWVAKTAKEQTDLESRYREPIAVIDDTLDDAQNEQLKNLRSPLQGIALDLLDHGRRASGALYRYPFWDKQLVELSLAIPGQLKWRDGYRRAVLRNAMADLLPDTVAWRLEKFNFFSRTVASFKAGSGPERMRTALYDHAGLVEPYANVPLARSVLERLLNGDETLKGLEVQFMWRTAMLGQWLANRRA